jgi:uncharacterized protein (DUF1499 family)
MRAARALVMAVCVAAFVMLVASGPGTRGGLWAWQAGLSLVKWAAWTGMIGSAAALVLVLLTLVPRFRPQAWVPLVALVFGVIAFVPPLLLLKQARSYPPIHDITTDYFDPPAFKTLMPVRQQAANGAAYGGTEVAKQQQQAFPDIKPLIVKTPPAETVQKAIDAARSLDWEVVSTDVAAGRVEATDTTAWFGFKDDIVIRVLPNPEGGSRVDVRSVSRVGKGDVGANAKRVRRFLAKLA